MQDDAKGPIHALYTKDFRTERFKIGHVYLSDTGDISTLLDLTIAFNISTSLHLTRTMTFYLTITLQWSQNITTTLQFTRWWDIRSLIHFIFYQIFCRKKILTFKLFVIFSSHNIVGQTIHAVNNSDKRKNA